MNGHGFDSPTLRIQLPGEEFRIASTDWHGWFSMFIPDEVIAHWNVSETAPIGSSSGFIQLTAERAEEFQRAIAQLGLIVRRAPDAFVSSRSVDATTRKLAELVREALGGNMFSTPKQGRPLASRKEIVNSVMDSVKKQDCEFLSVTEPAMAVGISEQHYAQYFRSISEWDRCDT